MSSRLPSEHLAYICNNARHLVEGTRDHEDHLGGLDRTAEGVVRQAACRTASGTSVGLSAHSPAWHRSEWERS